jgi:hypothetical protein
VSVEEEAGELSVFVEVVEAESDFDSLLESLFVSPPDFFGPLLPRP